MDQQLSPLSNDRVRRHTPSWVNDRIDRQTRALVEDTVRSGRDTIVARLQELDREWDVDRALMANFAIVGALSSELGRRVHRGWTYFFRAQLGFLLMHAALGWCPPLPVFRRLGFRTAKEIAEERRTLLERLKALSEPLPEG